MHNPEICSGRLSQQFQVHAFSCVEASRLSYDFFNQDQLNAFSCGEASRLSYDFFNQDQLRCETYQGISDYWKRIVNRFMLLFRKHCLLTLLGVQDTCS
jgi:hypothetical protein